MLLEVEVVTWLTCRQSKEVNRLIYCHQYEVFSQQSANSVAIVIWAQPPNLISANITDYMVYSYCLIFCFFVIYQVSY